MEGKMEKIKFKRSVIVMGDSLGLTIPKEIVEWLGISKGDELTITPDEGKHGKFSAIFKEKTKR
jgi:antitoxin component of MazEF toxin-antitoxin module